MTGSSDVTPSQRRQVKDSGKPANSSGHSNRPPTPSGSNSAPSKPEPVTSVEGRRHQLSEVRRGSREENGGHVWWGRSVLRAKPWWGGQLRPLIAHSGRQSSAQSHCERNTKKASPKRSSAQVIWRVRRSRKARFRAAGGRGGAVVVEARFQPIIEWRGGAALCGFAL